MGKVDFSLLKDDVFLLSPYLVPPHICSLFCPPLVMTPAKLIGECDFRSPQGPELSSDFSSLPLGPNTNVFSLPYCPSRVGLGTQHQAGSHSWLVNTIGQLDQARPSRR